MPSSCVRHGYPCLQAWGGSGVPFFDWYWQVQTASSPSKHWVSPRLWKCVARGFEYRFYPSPEQEISLAKTFGCARYVYNWALDLRGKAWRERQERINYSLTSAALTELKRQPEVAWLNEVSCVPVQQSLRHLQTAFVNFWQNGAAYPSFKKRDKPAVGGVHPLWISVVRWGTDACQNRQARHPLVAPLLETAEHRACEPHACRTLLCFVPRGRIVEGDVRRHRRYWHRSESGSAQRAEPRMTGTSTPLEIYWPSDWRTIQTLVEAV
jgi:hypothetical protein